MQNSLQTLIAFAALAMLQFSACKDEGIPLSDLPALVQTYVDDNYPGYTLDDAEKETLCNGATVFEVEIEQGEDENSIELTFDESGNFLYSESEIALTELPSAVTSSIGSNYGSYTAKEAEKLSLGDGSTQYKVELKNGNSEKEVTFDAEGAVICEQDEH